MENYYNLIAEILPTYQLLSDSEKLDISSVLLRSLNAQQLLINQMNTSAFFADLSENQSILFDTIDTAIAKANLISLDQYRDTNDIYKFNQQMEPWF